MSTLMPALGVSSFDKLDCLAESALRHDNAWNNADVIGNGLYRL
jgi:hypothetical protein